MFRKVRLNRELKEEIKKRKSREESEKEEIVEKGLKNQSEGDEKNIDKI